MLEIDRWRCRAPRSCREVLAHYEAYEFHPGGVQAAGLLLGRPGRLLPGRAGRTASTPPPQSLARRSAQTALWQITHAMLRWMAPFLSSRPRRPGRCSAVEQPSSCKTTRALPPDGRRCWPPVGRAWCEIRAGEQAIEAVRAGGVGSSLQAEVVTAPAATTRCLPAWART